MAAPSGQRVRLALPAGPHPVRQPLGQATRGKTRPGRLRQVDAFCALYAGSLLARRQGAWQHSAFVDLGFGENADTTLESASCFRRLNPQLPVLGVEIDPERVARAGTQALADPLTSFRLGGFNLPLEAEAGSIAETARLVRAFNVLRQYEAEAAGPAWKAMARGLAAGGLIVEGSSDPSGSLWVANVLRHAERADLEPRLEALVFGTRLRDFLLPQDFKAVLPKQLIHRVLPGQIIHRFFADWEKAAGSASPSRVWGPRQHFADSARELQRRGWTLDLRRRWLARGLLIWRRPEL